MNRFLCIAALVVPLTACATQSDPTDQVTVTSDDVAQVPKGQTLEVDLTRDATYLIELGNTANQSRIVLKGAKTAVSLHDWIGSAGLLASADSDLEDALAGDCAGGWQLQCSGNVCCTVCQATGAVGSCGKVAQ